MSALDRAVEYYRDSSMVNHSDGDQSIYELKWLRDVIIAKDTELAQLRSDLAQAQQRIAELGYTLDNCMQDAAELTAERDAARAQLATYQRREALRQ